MAVLDILLPPSCAACGVFGSLLCRRCRASFRAASDPTALFMAPDPGVVLGEAFEVAMSAFIYEGALRRALQRLKYGGVARLAEPLAEAAMPVLRLLVGQIGRAPLVPVPLHPVRQRERGYNQAALLARLLAAKSALPAIDLLTRERATRKQHQLDRAARLRNLTGAFAARGRAPPVVVLVDDIMTTSATLEACASVLHSSGVERVYGFTIAREV